MIFSVPSPSSGGGDQRQMEQDNEEENISRKEENDENEQMNRDPTEDMEDGEVLEEGELSEEETTATPAVLHSKPKSKGATSLTLSCKFTSIPPSFTLHYFKTFRKDLRCS